MWTHLLQGQVGSAVFVAISMHSAVFVGSCMQCSSGAALVHRMQLWCTHTQSAKGWSSDPCGPIFYKGRWAVWFRLLCCALSVE
jgi:hypothetical protein